MTRGLQARQARLIDKLKARTTRDGKPRAGYEQNVASLRAELAILQERLDNTKEQDLG